MRLSTAIMLGRNLVEKPTACNIKGCALGMGALAAGGYASQHFVESKWPWLRKRTNNLPCRCIQAYVENVFVITHIFDCHIMLLCPHLVPWTLEQLVDWIRSVEPAEPQEFSEVVEVLAGEAVSK